MAADDAEKQQNLDLENTETHDHIHDEKANLERKDTLTDIEWTFTRIIAFISLCLVYVGAQALLYMTGGTLSYIGPSIHSNFANWLLTANTLAVTAVVPFVGYITDHLGESHQAAVPCSFTLTKLLRPTLHCHLRQRPPHHWQCGSGNSQKPWILGDCSSSRRYRGWYLRAHCTCWVRSPMLKKLYPD